MPGPAPDHAPVRARGWVLWIIGAYALVTLALLPVASVQGPELPAITPFLLAAVLVTELSTSFLLFEWFSATRTWSLLLLACAYLFSASMVVAHLLTFPGAVVPGHGLLGGPQSASWTFLIWTDGYAALTLAATILEARAPDSRIGRHQVGTAVAAGCASVITVAGCSFLTVILTSDRLPSVTRGSSWTLLDATLNEAGMVMMVASVAIVLLVMRGRNPLYLWLAVALTAMLASNVLSLMSGGRYTLGWSVGRLNWMLSACTLFLFFMRRFVGQQRDLSRARATLEQRVNERTAALAETVRQRDLLLREVYHRVKNNLQVVDLLMMLERRRLTDPQAREALSELRNRVFTLGLVHQQLMASDDLERFSIAPFLRELCDNVSASFGAETQSLQTLVNADSVMVDLDFAIPVGLLTTELLSNAIKHAQATQVTIEFGSGDDGRMLLAVGDNGIDAEAGSRRLADSTGVGSRIIAGLTQQLGGRMDIIHRDGLRVEISLPMGEPA